MKKLAAYCTECGSPQGIFNDEAELRYKMTVQKKCDNCGAQFGFLSDGRIWNLRWELISYDRPSKQSTMKRKKLPKSGEVVELKFGDISDRKTEISLKFPLSIPQRLKYQFIDFLEHNCGFSAKFTDGIRYKITLDADVNKVSNIINEGFTVLDNKLIQLKEKHEEAAKIILGKSDDENKKKSIDETYWFDVALSFAGEHRAIAEDIKTELDKHGVSCFYDKAEQAKLWGKRLSKYFQQVYGSKTRFVVSLISKEYPVKDWTDFEFTIAREEAKHRKEEFVLPVRLDDTPVLGLPSDVAHLDLNEVGVNGVVESILYKLGRPSAITPSGITDFITTFGVPPEEIETRVIEFGDVLHPYVKVCDKLEQELIGVLKGLNLPDLKFMGDLRNGEGLSFRISFKWDLRKGYPAFGDISPWEILEITPQSLKQK